MKGYFHKLTSVMLVLATLLSLLAPTVGASADLADNSLKYLNKTATPLDSLDQTDVTLTVPGTGEGDIDIVFILGGGMTANIETIKSAVNVFKPAMECGTATVRVGMISLEKGKEIILDLNSDEALLDPATYVDFITEKLESINDLSSGTTNLHSQLLKAQKMLAAETKAKTENKYVFVMATGRTYWFDNANGEQSTVVNSVKGTDKNTYYYWGNYLWQSQRGAHSSLYMIPEIYNNSYANFLAAIRGWVAADGDKYVYTPHFDENDYSAYANWYSNNGLDLRALNLSNSRYGNAIVNPAPTAANFATGTVAAVGSGSNPQNALNYERAQYECIQVWQQLINAGYTCYAICSEAPNYQNGSENIASKGYTGKSTIQVGHAFMDYLSTLAGHGNAPVVWEYLRDENGKVVFLDGYEGNYNYAKTTLKEDFFASIHDDMIYTCAPGSTVVDYIGKNENGNFEFIESADSLSLIVGGVNYITAKVEDTAEGSSYTFTAPDAITPTFWLDYFYGNGTTTERFVWTFGESISTDRLAHLTYKLQLTEKSDKAGQYIVPTNNSATFYPVYSDGSNGTPVLFPIPTVEYIVEDDSIISIYGTKTWIDNDNADNKRPEYIIIRLWEGDFELASAYVRPNKNGEWKYFFHNLREYRNGVEIAYTITEDPVDGYTTIINGYNVTNIYVPEVVTVSGSKTWNDADDQDGKRPESITINLLANGVEVAEANVTAENGWSFSFDSLPKYENGVEIVYTVTEDTVAGYTATINGFDVTNTYIPETTTVSGSKTWNDADNQDGKRPESITINLLANGVEVAEANVTAENGWNYSFDNLPKYENGVEIVYTVTEDTVDGYTATINGFDVTNTYIPETTTVSGSKTWNDADDQDGKRPESITINLLANGVEVADANVTAENGWSFSFDNLPKYENGSEIIYTVTEDTVAGYTATINGFDVTNTYIPETITVSGSKTWNDADDQDGKRPESITINLLANGVEVAEANVTAENGWNYSFDNLPKYENGVEIVYTVTEDTVDGYTATINGFDVTNTYVPESIEVSVLKIWDDDDNSDKARPNSITVMLYANGVEIAVKELSELDNWAWTFTDLAKYEDGVEIVYTIAEAEIESYFTSITGDMYTGFEITNIYWVEIVESDFPLDPPDTGDAVLPAIIGALAALFLAVWIPTKKRQVEE